MYRIIIIVYSYSFMMFHMYAKVGKKTLELILGETGLVLRSIRQRGNIGSIISCVKLIPSHGGGAYRKGGGNGRHKAAAWSGEIIACQAASSSSARPDKDGNELSPNNTHPAGRLAQRPRRRYEN